MAARPRTTTSTRRFEGHHRRVTEKNSAVVVPLAKLIPASDVSDAKAVNVALPREDRMAAIWLDAVTELGTQE